MNSLITKHNSYKCSLSIMLVCLSSLSIYSASRTENIEQNIYNFDECPRIEIQCDLKDDCRGVKRKFVVNWKIGTDIQPTIKWSVSSGKIISGQSKPAIMVETKSPDKRMEIKVRLYKFAPKGCPNTASFTIE